MSSCPLKIIYDKRTVNALLSLFKTPEEMNLANLQHQAFNKLREYREATDLSLQYVIDNHKFIDVDIVLQSSFIIIPHGGKYTENCACCIVNLGNPVHEIDQLNQS